MKNKKVEFSFNKGYKICSLNKTYCVHAKPRKGICSEKVKKECLIWQRMFNAAERKAY